MSYRFFGKYLLLERLAVGGMGEVFLAKAGALGVERTFVVKRILRHQIGDDELVRTLLNEAHIAIGLSHPNIAQVFEVGNLEGHFYLAMEYVDGLSLADMLSTTVTSGSEFPAADAVFIAIQVCRALAYAHDKRSNRGELLNIVHRDISPQNVLVDANGSVKLIDFGIAKATSSDALVRTEEGVLTGKLGYMSPEHARGEELDRRADIYAVGILLCECLTLKRAFAGRTALEVLELIKQSRIDLPVVTARDEPIPKPLRAVLKRALAARREDRYADAGQMEKDLAGVLSALDDAYTPQRLAAVVERLDVDRAKRQRRFREYAELPADEPIDEAFDNNGPDVEGRRARRSTGGFEPFSAALAANRSARHDQARPGLRRTWLLPAIATGVSAVALAITLTWVLRTDDLGPRVPPPPAPPVVTAPLPRRAPRVIKVDSKPRDAVVWVSGVRRGTTPVILTGLEVGGEVRLRLEKDGYAAEERRIDAGEGDVIDMLLELTRLPPADRPAASRVNDGRAKARGRAPTPPAVDATGCLAAVVEPWADVYVNGDKAGTTPIKCFALEPGTYRVTLSNPALGVSRELEVRIQTGGTTRILEEL